jgi:cyclohexanone monooxygenase
VVADDELTTLPPRPDGAVFDPVEQAKYREFSESRRGAADYVGMEDEFGHYLSDLLSPRPVPRESLNDECDILIVGAGLAALMLWHGLAKAGFSDVRVCERGGDVGGTWYWNRYPGVACDVESYTYLPLLDETGYVPSMKFASGYEIFQYCQLVADQFEFYDHCLFHTNVERVEWDAADMTWRIFTDRGDAMRARVVILANGSLTTPKLARIKGMESFEGAWFHTSRWNYDVQLAGKRVGIIGTGATAVQVIPELAKVVDELYVFQRTPSTIDVRGQRETTLQEREMWSNDPGWSTTRRARYARFSAGRAAMRANDDFLAGNLPDLSEAKADGPTDPVMALERQLDSNYRIMEQIRARVDALVKDPATAKALKPYYTYGCKRPTFHDEYLPTFNLPHVHLVDTAPVGVAEITPAGVVHDGVEYPLDVLIYATGFQWMATSTFRSVFGANQESLAEKWARRGTSTFLGLHSSGFPNLLIIGGPQAGGGGFNFTLGMEKHVRYVISLLGAMREKGADVVDVRQPDEDEYVEHCREVDIETERLRDCLSYYNADGTAEPGSLAYYGGPLRWDQRVSAATTSWAPYVFSARSDRVAGAAEAEPNTGAEGVEPGQQRPETKGAAE